MIFSFCHRREKTLVGKDIRGDVRVSVFMNEFFACWKCACVHEWKCCCVIYYLADILTYDAIWDFGFVKQCLLSLVVTYLHVYTYVYACRFVYALFVWQCHAHNMYVCTYRAVRAHASDLNARRCTYINTYVCAWYMPI